MSGTSVRKTQSATSVRNTVQQWLDHKVDDIGIGLPEFDDRLALWRIPLVSQHDETEPVGEVRVRDGKVVFSTDLNLAKKRGQSTKKPSRARTTTTISFPPIPSQIVLGDATDVLEDYPPESIQLIFTSPPYFSAKPEYHESENYADYLEMLRSVFMRCHRVLAEGRFLVVNTSPVLIRRPHRNASSRRIPITFDLHGILDELGFEFIDDIFWQKPEEAGWRLGRGSRFAADRQPLQYKPVIVTENIIVYRKRTNKLIDWNLRKHPDQDAIKNSLVEDGYETTNIWQIQPANHEAHPAVFPEALADRIIRYYSFMGDMVLDPFSGVGTVGKAAGKLNRRFMLIEKSMSYFDIQKNDLELMQFSPEIYDYEFFAGSVP